jgi:hypothetical protein
MLVVLLLAGAEIIIAPTLKLVKTVQVIAGRVSAEMGVATLQKIVEIVM